MDLDHSTDAVIRMAREAHGPGAEALFAKAEPEQDFWTIWLGPDAAGRVHTYMVMVWEDYAVPASFETVEVEIRKPADE